MKQKVKNKFVFLVYCNVEPIIYAVYSNKKSAVQYAKQLINWRFDNAVQRKYEYGHYHYFEDNNKIKETEFCEREKVIFSTCLKIKDGNKDWSDDGCLIKVVRKPLLNKY